MQLPDGVVHRPREVSLIAKDEPAAIRIETESRYPVNAHYNVNDRSFEDAIAPFLRGDWEDFDRLFRLNPRRVVAVGGQQRESSIIYSGAEHSGSPKKPNITVVPNMKTKESRGLPSAYVVMGCTMGHFHPKDSSGYRIQEVYEFQSHGILVMDRENGAPEIWVAKDGDKIAVPNGCHMTLYNLGDENHPLITLDFANPEDNPPNKGLIKHYGPILLTYYDEFGATVVLNRLYANNIEHPAGVRIGDPVSEEVRSIIIPRAGRMDLGRFLYEELTGNPEVIGKFQRLGLCIRKASTQAALEPITSGTANRLYFSRPLAKATAPGSEVYNFFFRTQAQQPQLPQDRRQGDNFVKALKTKSDAIKQMTDLKTLNRPLLILVQGVGDWVEKAYRPTFELVAGNQDDRIKVFYIDDTSWKGARPSWAQELEPWETYLDKSVSKDLAIYHNVLSRADAVFVVTPDFTHSEIAKECIRRRAPLVLIEKPFDSHIENVESLMKEIGSLYRLRAVVGLDHYMFYAVELKNMMAEIQEHLGGALAAVEFYMAETKGIERGRERTLQHGLTLDMLPHMLGMLSFFGQVETIDDIKIIQAGQYEPLYNQDKDGNPHANISSWYRNETYSRVKFTFEDYAGNRVPCLGVVGKGFSEDVKYMEFVGVNGNAVRVDLMGKKPMDYPYDSIFFVSNPEHPSNNADKVSDPYNSARSLYILPSPRRRLDRERYRRLIEDLIEGEDKVISNVLLLEEAYKIVSALDRIWWAIQDARDRWTPCNFRELKPVQPESNC